MAEQSRRLVGFARLTTNRKLRRVLNGEQLVKKKTNFDPLGLCTTLEMPNLLFVHKQKLLFTSSPCLPKAFECSLLLLQSRWERRASLRSEPESGLPNTINIRQLFGPRFCYRAHREDSLRSSQAPELFDLKRRPEKFNFLPSKKESALSAKSFPRPKIASHFGSQVNCGTLDSLFVLRYFWIFNNLNLFRPPILGAWSAGSSAFRRHCQVSAIWRW